MKERVRFYGIVDFRLEDGDEAGFAELLVVLGAYDESPGGVAQCAGAGRHDQTMESALLKCIGQSLQAEGNCYRSEATGSLNCPVLTSQYE